MVERAPRPDQPRLLSVVSLLLHFGLPPARRTDSGRAIPSVLAVLGNEDLDEDELEVFSSGGASTRAAAARRLYERRLARAMAAGSASLGVAGAHRPSVSVLPALDDPKAAGEQLNASIQAIVRCMRGQGERLLVLAAPRTFQKLRQVLPAPPGEARASLRYHQLDSPEPLGDGDAGLVEVVELEVTIDGLERALEDHFGADGAPSKGAAAETREGLDDSLAAAFCAGGAPDSLAPVPAKHPKPAQPRATAEDVLLGTLFHGKYRILKVLGRGGFGVVYEAIDERGAGNRVAIKVLTAETSADPEQQRAFRDEARRVTRLSHPNVVDWKVFDENEEGRPYFVMELVRGEELSETLKREGQLAPERVGRMLVQILGALHAAHHLSPTESILHLDLKPQNVFRIPPRGGTPEAFKVLDFGIGQYITNDTVDADQVQEATEGEAPELDPLAMTEPMGSLTFQRPRGSATGRVSTGSASSGVKRTHGCTPEYASPEQCAHVLFEDDIVALDGRSDLYSLGVLAFQALTGELPFKSPKNRLDVLRLHREEPPPTLASRGVKAPVALVRFVQRALAKDRGDRWASAAEARAHLEAWLSPPAWRTALRAVAVVGVIAAGVIGYLLATREAPIPRAALADLSNAPIVGALPLGPATPSAELTLRLGEDAAGVARSGAWLVVSTRDFLPLVGWSAEWLPGDAGAGVEGPPRVAIRVDAEAARLLNDQVTLQEVELWLVGDRLRTGALQIAWVGADALELRPPLLGAVPLDLVAGRAVIPAATPMTVEAGGPARDYVEHVEVESPAGRLAAARIASDRPSVARFGLALSEPALGLGVGVHELTIRVRDRAANVWTRSFEVRVDAPRPIVERLELVDDDPATFDVDGPACPRIDDAFSLSPRHRPALALQVSRPVDVVCRRQVDGGAEVELFRLVQVTEVHQPLGDVAAWATSSTFGATLRIALDESRYVLGADAALPVNVVRLRHSNGELGFSARLAVPGTPRLEPEPAAATFVNHTPVSLELARERPEPMLLVCDWWPVGDVSRVSHAKVDALVDVGETTGTVALTLDEAGLYRVRVRSYRVSTSGQAADEHDVEQVFALGLDLLAPTVAVQADAAADTGVSVAFSEPTSLAPALDLRWRVEDAASGRFVSEGAMVGHPSASVAVLSPAVLWPDGPTDGAFRLRLSGADVAGNELAPVEAQVVIAREGPAIELERPLDGGLWTPGDDGDWTFRAVLADPNGVAEPLVSLAYIVDPTRAPVAVPLEFTATPAGLTRVLTGRARFDYRASNAVAVLRIEAADGVGVARSEVSRTKALPVISRPRPARVTLQLGAEGLPARMALVEGNERFRYTFGGRGDSTENLDFRVAGIEGLGAFNADPIATRARSWQVDVPEGLVGDMYLDEDEVTVGQFLQFLTAADGYVRREAWRGGTAPAGERCAALLDTLAGVDPSRPVTGVTWYEADAYAHWTGRRLPSWLEWEFAVRRGQDYEVSTLTWRSNEASGAVPANMPLADLCLEVSEWTSTLDTGDAYPHLAAARDPRAFFAHAGPETSGGRWAVGGNDTDHRVDFAAARAVSPDAVEPWLGFRCAVSLENVQRGLEGDRHPRWRGLDAE